MAKIYTIHEALAKMRLQCSRAEHSSGEIREKLRRMGMNGGDIHKIIESLKVDRYIDDERFAGAFVRDKFIFSKWGRRKIAYALAGKGLSPATIREALNMIEEDEYLNTAKKLAKAKSKGMVDMNYEAKSKIYRWLLSRGFESSVASEAVRELLNPEF